MLAREKKQMIDGLRPLFDRLQLRFVKRGLSVPDGDMLPNYTKVLQYRILTPRINEYKEFEWDADEWVDVPVEEDEWVDVPVKEEEPEAARRDYRFNLEPSLSGRCIACVHIGEGAGYWKCKLLTIAIANAERSWCPMYEEEDDA